MQFVLNRLSDIRTLLSCSISPHGVLILPEVVYWTVDYRVITEKCTNRYGFIET
jgi:hypothetical protein